MTIDCQSRSLLEIYLKTVIVGFGQADVLGLSLVLPCLKSIDLFC